MGSHRQGAWEVFHPSGLKLNGLEAEAKRERVWDLVDCMGRSQDRVRGPVNEHKGLEPRMSLAGVGNAVGRC